MLDSFIVLGNFCRFCIGLRVARDQPDARCVDFDALDRIASEPGRLEGDRQITLPKLISSGHLLKLRRP
jgi:hypothetical protein